MSCLVVRSAHSWWPWGLPGSVARYYRWNEPETRSERTLPAAKRPTGRQCFSPGLGARGHLPLPNRGVPQRLLAFQEPDRGEQARLPTAAAGRLPGEAGRGRLFLRLNLLTCRAGMIREYRRKIAAVGLPVMINGQGKPKMARLIFITHPEVTVNPILPVPRWRLGGSDFGIARMRMFADGSVVAAVTSVWASTEAKAIKAAGILAARLGVGIKVAPDLGENDRSATGFLPPDEFEEVASAFFADPEQSVRGWERAIDAQKRVRGAVDRIVAGHRDGGSCGRRSRRCRHPSSLQLPADGHLS